MIRISCSEEMYTFMYNKFPSLVCDYLLSRVSNLTKDKRDLLDKLLQEEFKLKGIYQLINLFIKHLKVNNYQHKDYYITVEDIVINKHSLESIVRTVDYGNSKVPPFNLFNTSLIFVNNKLEALYKYTCLGVN